MASSAALPTLALSLGRLQLTTTIGAPKRSRAVGHGGASSDSSMSVALVALSRLVRTREYSILEPASRSPVGAPLMEALRAAVLKVARAAGGADAALSEANVQTYFNQSASTIANQRLYTGGLSLPARLPWPSAKALLAALLDSLTAVAMTAAGVSIAAAVSNSNPPAVDTALIASVVAAVEAGMAARLDGSSGGGSSSASGRSTPPLPIPMPIPMPPPAQQTFAVDAGKSLAANVQRLVEARLRRQLSPSEREAVRQALEEGLSVLQAGGAEAGRSLLESNMLVALTRPPAAHLWASVLEASERGVSSLTALTAAIVDVCSDLAAMLFASALGL